MALPENWQDDIGMQVDAEFLNQLGEEHNALLDNKFKAWTQTELDALPSRDPDVLYVVVDD